MSLNLKMNASQTQVFKIGQLIEVLQMTTGELDELLAETARLNPLVVLHPRKTGGVSATDVLEMTAVEEASSLYDHVFRELAGLIMQGGQLARLVIALIEELDRSGWLGRAVPEIAASLGIKSEVVEIALKLVQKRVEPAGLFARNLEECLRLQLEDQNAMSETMGRVLAHLGVLEKGSPACLSKATGLAQSEVARCLSAIRRLNPKPGSNFLTDIALVREPDVKITPSATGWEIEFCSAQQSNLTILPMPKGKETSEMRDALTQARALKRALELRQSALKQVVRVLVDRQNGYFHDGPEALEPMTMSGIAQITGFHLSTVSRVLNGLLIEGPHGVIAARVLCAGAASAKMDHSRPKVQARIRAMLAAEDSAHPLSDRALTARLQAENIFVSRRIVSRYRQQIGLSPAAKRRLYA